MTLSTPDQIAVPIPRLDEAGTFGSVARELRRAAPGLHLVDLEGHVPPRLSGGRPRVRLIRDGLRIPAAIAGRPLLRPLRMLVPPGERLIPVAAGLPAAFADGTGTRPTLARGGGLLAAVFDASALVPTGQLPPVMRRMGRATPFSPRASRV